MYTTDPSMSSNEAVIIKHCELRVCYGRYHMVFIYNKCLLSGHYWEGWSMALKRVTGKKVTLPTSESGLLPDGRREMGGRGGELAEILYQSPRNLPMDLHCLLLR